MPESLFGRLVRAGRTVGVTLLVIVALIVRERRDLEYCGTGAWSSAQVIAEASISLAQLPPGDRAAALEKFRLDRRFLLTNHPVLVPSHGESMPLRLRVPMQGASSGNWVTTTWCRSVPREFAKNQSSRSARSHVAPIACLTSMDRAGPRPTCPQRLAGCRDPGPHGGRGSRGGEAFWRRASSMSA